MPFLDAPARQSPEDLLGEHSDSEMSRQYIIDPGVVFE